MFWKRFFRIKTAVIALTVLILIFFIAIFAPFLAPYDPIEQSLFFRRELPNKEHIFGRDMFGRDILSRIICGARVTMFAGLFGVTLCTFFGVISGVISGFYGGKIDAIIMRFVDILLSFPYFLLAILMVSVLGTGLWKAVIAVAIASLPRFTRIIRGAVLNIINNDYIESTKALGATNFRIIFNHIIPNIIPTIIVFSTLELARIILSTSALSFLGLGAQPPMAEWGLMLNEAKGYLMVAPHMSIIPGMFIMIFVLTANLLGDGLRDVLDPKLK